MKLQINRIHTPNDSITIFDGEKDIIVKKEDFSKIIGRENAIPISKWVKDLSLITIKDAEKQYDFKVSEAQKASVQNSMYETIKDISFADLSTYQFDTSKKYRLYLNNENLSHNATWGQISDLSGVLNKLDLIEEITFMDSVTKIPNEALWNSRSIGRAVIPSTVEEIGDFSLRYFNANEIVFNKGLKTIGRQGLYGCSAIKLDLPEGLTTLKDEAFARCENLVSVHIPEGIKSIGKYLFMDCKKLIEVNFPKDWTSIPPICFQSCNSLNNIVIPSYITDIQSAAFSCCNSLTNIILPDTLTRLGSSAFSSCSNLSYITLPNSIIEIDCRAFSSSGIKEITLPPKITEISDELFSNCKSLASVKIPSLVTHIGSYAFSNCTSLESIELPASVETMGSAVFNGCDNLVDIIIDPKNKFLAFEKGIFYNSDKTSILFCRDNINGDVIISDTVTTINEKAFENTQKITSISIASNVSSIGSGAFRRSNASKIEFLGENLKTIKKETFEYCDFITDMTIPNGVENIEEFIFYSCDALASITLPVSLKKIGRRITSGCPNLKSINYLGTMAQWEAIDIYPNQDVPNDLIIHCTDGDLPARVRLDVMTFEQLNAYQFDPNKKYEITINNSCMSHASENNLELANFIKSHENIYRVIMTNCGVAPNAFKDCKNLKSVYIDANTAREIGNFAFSGCENLVDIPMSFNIKRIGDSAFEGCSKLASISLSTATSYLGVNSFKGCTNLKEVSFEYIWDEKFTKESWNNTPGVATAGFEKGCVVHCYDGDLIIA